MKKCTIICALIEGYGDWIIDETKDSYVICADGGYAFAKVLDIKPDLIVGDFDSYDGDMPDSDKIEIIKVDSVKDDTDTGLCLKEALKRGYKEIKIIGGVGGRLSHTIANIQNMLSLSSKASIELVDGDRRIYLIKGPKNLELKRPNDEPENEKKHYVSLFAIGGECQGVNISGAFYPLNDAVLTTNFPLGVSNEFTGEVAKISVKKGNLLVIVE